MPVVRVSVVRGHWESRSVGALLDTGAGYNIVAMSAATTMLGMTAERIRAEGTPAKVRPLDGKDRTIYGWQADLRLKADTFSTDSLLLPNTWIYVMEETHPQFAVLIGQFGGFEGRIFKHHNRPQNRFWELRS